VPAFFEPFLEVFLVGLARVKTLSTHVRPGPTPDIVHGVVLW
jgi:hypothetical protein